MNKCCDTKPTGLIDRKWQLGRVIKEFVVGTDQNKSNKNDE